ncbi:MAG: hypothetical protein IIY06_01825 [Proteobacteria bacterium]|nr:hypothetical protein [Pseudomonadota bacterium]
MLRRIGIICLVCISTLAVFNGNALEAQAAENLQTFIEYSGEIVDQNALAVSAVLPLEFRVYTTENGKKAIATEKHFVSVVDGKYSVTLGDASAINASNATLYVAVLLDGKELTRQRVSTERHLVNNKVVSNVQQTKTVDMASLPDGEFKLTCPKGYVVTGISGKSANGQLASIQLICSNTF